ncbi:MAG: hypothetical protein M3P40_11430 [Actinomycetota bacterium]|nr:hypothetical protein [Actinomycetota bacterium]
MENADDAIRQLARDTAGAAPLDATLTRAVFERFPFGLLVLAADGSVVAGNGEAARLLALDDHAVSRARCCTLFGCGVADGPLQDVCLTERALRDARALPDVRIDYAQDATEPRSVWVATAPIGPGQVLMQLRAGRVGDRRRRTDPHWTSGPALRVTSLGRTQLATPEGPLEGAWLRQRSGQLLKLLVCNRERITHSDEIAITFWPENERTGLQNVRHFVHGLRSHLEPGRAPRARSSFVLAHEGGYALDLSRIRIDADEFEQHAKTGLRAFERSDGEVALASLERAVALYGGDFLADEPYAEWAFTERARLHDLASQAVTALADIALRTGAVETGTDHLRRLARMEPLDSDVQQRLIRLLLTRGRSGEALRHYRHAHATWMSVLGEKPDFDLASLRRQARSTG